MLYLQAKIFRSLQEGRSICFTNWQGWKPKYLIRFGLVLLTTRNCCVRHRSTNFQEMNICPGFQQSLILWQSFNLGSSSSLDSWEKLQLTDTVWFGVTDAMRFSESLLFSKPCNFLIAAGQTSTCDWWERPAANTTLHHHCSSSTSLTIQTRF